MPDLPSRRSDIAELVYEALPAKGRLAFVIDVQAKARKRLTRPQVVNALHELEAEGRAVHRAPFDVGRPNRWGRS